MSEQKEFFAVFSNNLVKGPDGKPTLSSYPVPNAKPVTVSNHVKGFIYLCPATKSYDVHEAFCGIRIAGGETEDRALRETAKFIQVANPDLFLIQVQSAGPARRHPAVSYEAAMDMLTPRKRGQSNAKANSKKV